MQAVLLQQLTSLLTGIDEADAIAVVSPSTGLPGKFPRLTAYNLNKWLESRAQRPSQTAYKPRTEPKDDNWSPPTPEDKKRVSTALASFKAGLVFDEPEKKYPPKHIGHHNPDALLKALER